MDYSRSQQTYFSMAPLLSPAEVVPAARSFLINFGRGWIQCGCDVA
jgi:hypothetical protein